VDYSWNGSIIRERNYPLSKDALNLYNLIEDYIRFGFRVEHGRSEPIERADTGQDDWSGTSVSEDRYDSENRHNGQEDLDTLAEKISHCSRCDLHKGRSRSVPGEGDREPLVVVVGEGPGLAEDRSGRPFVGPAGQYLDKWLAAVKIGEGGVPLDRRTNTFIANVVKCRPPNNRDPQPEEIAACLPYLDRQIGILKPKVILCVGRVALQTLTHQTTGIGAGRGKVYSYRQTPLVPTYHPSAVLRNQQLRAPVWEDLKLLKSVLENERLR
jgi:DNA polymerase